MTYTSPGAEVYTLYLDALKQPHLLIAGATGSGKSVIINGLIYTALNRIPGCQPQGTELILIDPKRVELAPYKDMPHTIAYASGLDPQAWYRALSAALNIMDRRYADMEKRGLRMYDGGDLYVIIDEWAALVTCDLRGHLCEKAAQRLSCEGRAARVHLIIATQTPKAEILSTRIKCNIDWRFCLRTNNRNESRLIMENAGCENLPRYGEGYYVRPGISELCNIPMMTDDELDAMTAFWRKQKPLTKKTWSLFRH